MEKKEWKDLKARQKQRLSEIMFRAVCDYYREHETMPEESEIEPLARKAYNRMCGSGLSLSFDSILTVFIKKQNRFEERIAMHGLPESLKPKVKKTEAEKLALKRAARKRKKQKLALERQTALPEQDDRFFFIAGYTSGGAPYGVTWEEMGMEPWQSMDDTGECEDI